MKYEEALLLPSEERRKVAAREILAKIKDKTLEAERIAFCYPESDYISVCAVGAFLAYKLDFNRNNILGHRTKWIYKLVYEDVMKELGFTAMEYYDLHRYFEQEMIGNKPGFRTQNLQRVFEFIAETGRIPSVMDHTILEGE